MKPLILLTNDDGIRSPGLAAAASALDPLGDLLIIAPLNQQTSMGRSRNPYDNGDGTFTEVPVQYGNNSWSGLGIKASPARAVEHAVVEVADRPISLVVSGINYGENIGTVITVSGTIGAALEAADWGVPALAVSQEISGLNYRDYSKTVDFTSAVHFTRKIAEVLLVKTMPFDTDVLKLDVPLAATPETAMMVTKLDRKPYYGTQIEERETLIGTSAAVTHFPRKGEFSETGTDAYALAQGLVSITPLSLDLTSRVLLDDVALLLDIKPPQGEEPG